MEKKDSQFQGGGIVSLHERKGVGEGAGGGSWRGRSSLVPRPLKALEREREGRNKTTAHIQSSGIKLIVQ